MKKFKVGDIVKFNEKTCKDKKWYNSDPHIILRIFEKEDTYFLKNLITLEKNKYHEVYIYILQTEDSFLKKFEKFEEFYDKSILTND
ncbi:MAG: hypothetical protein ABIP51_04175 [Bacteroidia bacterium]